jgi:Cu(I)/Ag(I) efflux system protein CusF
MKSLVKAAMIATLALSSVSGAYAQSEPATAAASNSMSTGEVKKVDKSAGKVTIKHGPLKNIGMDAMTMVFRVKEPSMLEQVKAGDKINFVAEEPNGQLTVTKLEKQQ